MRRPGIEPGFQPLAAPTGEGHAEESFRRLFFKLAQYHNKAYALTVDLRLSYDILTLVFLSDRLTIH
jgi:hypothetical protein